jgi:hypothetical protein
MLYVANAPLEQRGQEPQCRGVTVNDYSVFSGVHELPADGIDAFPVNTTH